MVCNWNFCYYSVHTCVYERVSPCVRACVCSWSLYTHTHMYYTSSVYEPFLHPAPVPPPNTPHYNSFAACLPHFSMSLKASCTAWRQFDTRAHVCGVSLIYISCNSGHISFYAPFHSQHWA